MQRAGWVWQDDVWLKFFRFVHDSRREKFWSAVISWITFAVWRGSLLVSRSLCRWEDVQEYLFSLAGQNHGNQDQDCDGVGGTSFDSKHSGSFPSSDSNPGGKYVLLGSWLCSTVKSGSSVLDCKNV